MSVFGGPDIVTDGLVLHLDAANRKSYPLSGSTIYDLSGNGNNGTFGASTAAPTFSGDNGGCLSFDGSNDYININSLTLTGNITVTAWIFMNSGGVYQHVVDSSNNSWHLAITSSNRPYLYAGTWSNSGVQLSISQWYMIAGVYDNDNSTLKYYVNGDLSHSMSAS